MGTSQIERHEVTWANGESADITVSNVNGIVIMAAAVDNDAAAARDVTITDSFGANLLGGSTALNNLGSGVATADRDDIGGTAVAGDITFSIDAAASTNGVQAAIYIAP